VCLKASLGTVVHGMEEGKIVCARAGDYSMIALDS